jgi:phosphonopyruvate decarboxylase
MLQAKEFISTCTSRGYNFFTGVPCSFLKPLINDVIRYPDLDYISASSEGEAVGIAAGAYLAGQKGVVMCQNSGLGNTVNPLASLNFPFRIPLLLIITLRGEPGLQDEPQHELMGQITGALLDTLRIHWTFFPQESAMVGKTFDKAERHVSKTGLPFALVMKKGSVAGADLKHSSAKSTGFHTCHSQGTFALPPAKRMSRMEAIGILKQELSESDALVATTGKIGRELFTLGDGDNQLYVVGSMGCAAGIGFGIQYVKKHQRVVVLDGDGAALMKMGTLATIGHYQPSGLIHVVLDNESYESTGGQFTVSPSVDFCTIASGCGYRQCYRVDSKSDLKKAVHSIREIKGPSLIHVKVSKGSGSDLGRPNVGPADVRTRFMNFLKVNEEKLGAST